MHRHASHFFYHGKERCTESCRRIKTFLETQVKHKELVQEVFLLAISSLDF
jgi:hypothetical protein